MATFDNHYVLLTKELKEIIVEELEKHKAAQRSVFLMRQVGMEEFMFRSYRSPEIQHIESLINRMETILEKTSMPREESILSVLDSYRSLFNEKDFLFRKKTRPKIKDYSLENSMLALLEKF